MNVVIATPGETTRSIRPFAGSALTVYTSCVAELSGSVAASFEFDTIRVPPSTTASPVFTAMTGASFTGVTVIANVPVTVNAPSVNEKLKPSEVVSPPSWT